MWRILGLIAFVVAIVLCSWLLDGGLAVTLRGASHAHADSFTLAHALDALDAAVRVALHWAPFAGTRILRLLIEMLVPTLVLLLGVRLWTRSRRRYERLRIEAYRTDVASAEALVGMLETLHRRLQRRWWRRLLTGQPSLALETHYVSGSAWLAVSCPQGSREVVQAALRIAYPNCRLVPADRCPAPAPALLRLKKHSEFIKRAKILDGIEHEREPAMNRLLTMLGSCGGDAFVQLALTPAPILFEQHAKRLYRRHEARLSGRRRDHLRVRDRSLVEDAELRGGLQIQHRPLFFVDLRVVAPDRDRCERIASELRSGEAENRLVERGMTVRQGLLGLYDRRVLRGEGNPLPSWQTGVFAPPELAAIWHLPSGDYAAVPLGRNVLPVAPAPPAIMRRPEGTGTLRDALGPVCIHPEMRRQNTAVPGTVEQGKSSYLVATVAEDLRRERCAVIVLDPKGDAAEAAVSLVPEERTCTFLDLARPTCGFDPLAADAPGDVIADYVVEALRQLFSDADIRASSDRYLRNAIIAILAYDRSSTLWDAARLLSVGEEGYAYRSRVGARVRGLPELKEISEFFTAELSAQLADARGPTTAKLDAPVNKLARLLNSPSIKRVLLNDSLRVDFDRVIAGSEVLVVKGALGAMGAGNTAVLMQLLVGMLNAALARQQDLVPIDERVAVALKVDEAPLVLNRGFAETMALKRSAGLETVACWQTESQWTDSEIREQLDALFAHRVYFATGSVRDARSSVGLTMAEFSDTIRPGIERLSALGRPDARLHLPRHHAIVSWSTPEGRQSPFVAETIPLCVSAERLAFHAARQAERGGRYLSDLRQPHWNRAQGSRAGGTPRPPHASTDQEANIGVTDDLGRDEELRKVAVTKEHQHGPTPDECARTAPLKPGSDERDSSMQVAPESIRELVELDAAHGARRVRLANKPCAVDPDPLDLEILALVASMGHVLSSQVHRRFNPGKAATTTQRRLKRLADAGLLGRLQFHRRDGGGVPMCCSITAAGVELLHRNGHREAAVSEITARSSPSSTAPTTGAMRHAPTLRQVRHDVHVAGWALALTALLGGLRPSGKRSSRDGATACWSSLRLRGSRESVLMPPMRSTVNGRLALGPDDLLLSGGRVAHDFLHTDATGQRTPVERFETVRPDATVEVPEALVAESSGQGAVVAVDLLIELDDRLTPGPVAGKLERYDHLLAGWSSHTRRYGRNGQARPIVVFVCRDRARARECARRADLLLGACQAYAGEYPADWEYPGRAGILFVAERDVHFGSLCAYGMPRLPPHVRITVAGKNLRTHEARAERRELPVVIPVGRSAGWRKLI